MRRTILLCLLAALAIAPAAWADSVTTKILRDCEADGQLQGHYTPAQLRKALDHMPADEDEYTDCRDVIQRAALAGVADSGGGGSSSNGGGGGSSSGGGGTSSPGGGSGGLVAPSTPADQKAISDAASHGAPDAVQIGGRPVRPGSAGLASDAVRNGLPSTFLVVLILLGAAAVASAGPFVRRRVLARRRS